MTEKKFQVTCSDTNGIDTDIISRAISLENFLLTSGETPQGYTRVELLKLAVDMKKVEILGDIEEDLSVIRESLRNGFLEELRNICLKFDSKAGYYFDPNLVGLSLLTFATNPDINMDDCIEVDDKEYEKEFRELSDDYD